MSDHEHVRGVSASALPSQPQSTCCLPFVSPGELRDPMRGYLFPVYPGCRLGFPTGTGKHQCLEGSGNTCTQVWS